MNNTTVAFIGAGNMSQAIFAGMIKAGFPAQNIIATRTNQEALAALHQQYGVNTTSDNLAAIAQADVVVLAVKPQMMEQVLQPIKQAGLALEQKLFISVAAGLTIARLNTMLGLTENTSRLVRCMPNTPSLIGLGMSGLYAPTLSHEDKAITEMIMSGTGEFIWLEREEQINHVIAAAGSAPAYFFLFMEAMQQKAQALGFDEATARKLVQQTALGAAHMVASQAEPISTLRAKVTSKGGTTHEAVSTLQQHHLTDIVAKAMQAAIDRAEEMAKQL